MDGPVEELYGIGADYVKGVMSLIAGAVRSCRNRTSC